MNQSAGGVEPNRRVVYTATIDDAVAAYLRQFARRRSIRRIRRSSALNVGLLFGVVAFLAVPGTAVLRLLAGSIGFLLGGTYYWLMYPRILRTYSHKQLVETRGTKGPIPYSVELRSDGVWYREQGLEILAPWAIVEAIVEDNESIWFDLSNSGTVLVRKRAFPMPDAAAEFIAEARRLKETGPAAPPTSP